MEIFPDPTHAALLALPFVAAAFALHVILWRPLMDWLDEREGVAEQALAEAASHKQQSESALQAIEERLVTARRGAAKARQEARERAQQRDADVLAAARTDADQRIEQAVQNLRAEHDQATKTIEVTAQTLAADISARLLPRQKVGQA